MSATLKMYTESYRWDNDERDEPTDMGTDTETWDVREDDDETTVVQVMKVLDLYSLEPSSTGPWHCGMWYSDVDGYEHPYTGVVERYTFHLDDLSEGDQRAVWALVTKA